jgi:hypothetical protein
MEQSPSCEADSRTGGQKLSTFVEFLARARHWNLSRTNLNQSTSSHPTSIASIYVFKVVSFLQVLQMNFERMPASSNMPSFVIL